MKNQLKNSHDLFSMNRPIDVRFVYAACACLASECCTICNDIKLIMGLKKGLEDESIEIYGRIICRSHDSLI